MNTDNHLPKDNSSVPGRTNDPETFAKFASVKSYQDYLTDKDNPVVMVTLTVNEQGFLDNTTFETYLTQHTNAHDEFTIVVSDTAIDDFYGQVMRNSKNLLGEPITIHIHHKGAVVQSFKGIIAQVSDKRNEGGGYGNLYISGYGLSILLDSGEECQSYEDKTLPEIIAEATNEYGDVKVNTKGMVNTKYKIPYVVQYKESDYQFIQRLARRYGEFFFYDGTQLQFNNETRQTVQLSEGDDLIEVSFALKIQPQHFSYLSYGVEKGEVEEKNTKNVRLQDKGNPFQFAAVKASEKVFTKKTKVPYNAFTEEFRGDYLADNVRREKESREQLMEVRGRSRNPNLRIGGFVKLKDINDKPMESYRIIDIKHHQSGYDYENEFVAIPDVYIAYYYDREALPRAEQQIARVTDNNDPKGLGRVRVQFIWQVAKKLQTPWIRVVQPHAGGGKGFYFIPEIGEEVLVDFEDQNAERPFVVGSHYNGKEYSPFHNTNNDIKAIQTRSGHKLIFTEDESILLSDKNGNTLRFDTQGKNIEISAPESISLCAGKDINLSAGNNLLMDVANVASFNILQQLLVNTPYMKQLVTELFHTQAGKALINSDNQIKIEAKEMNVAGMQKLLLHSDQDAVVNSKGYLDMRGEQGNKMKNKAEGYEAQSTAQPMGAKNFIAYFVPHKNWKGEFGFDWIRDGELDGGKDGGKDVFHYQNYPFEGIIGRYYKDDTYTNLCDEENGICEKIELNSEKKEIKKVFFKTKKNLYKKAQSHFTQYTIPFKNNSEYTDDKIYSVPILTLLKGEKAKLSLMVKHKLKKDTPKKISLKFKKTKEITSSLKISQKEFTKIKQADWQKKTFYDFEIECTEEFGTMQTLYAYVDGVKCGELNIHPNSSRFQKQIKVVFIRVKTAIDDKTHIGKIEKGGIEEVKKILKQALVFPTIVEEPKVLLCDDRESSAALFIQNGSDEQKTTSIVETLEVKAKKQYEGKYDDYYRIYFVAEDFRNEKNKKIHFSVKEKRRRINNEEYDILSSFLFDGYEKTTIVHELLHCMGLPHTFASVVDKDGITPVITYEKGQTDNVMDYTDKDRICIYYWQWKIINENIIFKGSLQWEE